MANFDSKTDVKETLPPLPKHKPSVGSENKHHNRGGGHGLHVKQSKKSHGRDGIEQKGHRLSRHFGTLKNSPNDIDGYVIDIYASASPNKPSKPSEGTPQAVSHGHPHAATTEWTPTVGKGGIRTYPEATINGIPSLAHRGNMRALGPPVVLQPDLPDITLTKNGATVCRASATVLGRTYYTQELKKMNAFTSCK